MEYKNERYMGCLFVRDRAFCRQLSDLLRQQVGSPIEKIGDLDVTGTL